MVRFLRAAALVLSVAAAVAPLAAAPDAPGPPRSVADYVARGVPPPDRAWSAPNLQAAASALQKVKAESPRALPRRGSPESGAVFARMVDPANLAVLRDPKVELSARLGDSLERLTALNQLVQLYFEPAIRHKLYASEVTGLIACQLDLMAGIFPLMEEFLASLPPEERETPARQSGLAKVRRGLSMMITGALTTLNETGQYGSDAVGELAERMAPVLPALLPRLEAGDRDTCTAQMRQLADGHPDGRVRRALAAVLGIPPSERRDAEELGRQVGQVVGYVMAAAVVIWLLVRMVRRG